MKDKRNNSIDIFRLVCALLVVAIHTHPFADINEYVGYFCTSVLTRIAVPFFFCVSGYYYVEKLEKIGLRAFKDTSKKILKIYIVWSIIYSVINVIQYINSGANINGIMYTLFIDFFINGSYYHFWYFIALFISIILVTICYKMKMQNIFFYGTIILYVIGLLGCSYYAVGNHIPVVNYIINLAGFEWFRKMFFMGVPFFSLGYFIKRYLEKDNGRTMKIYQIVLVIGVFLAEIIVVNQLGWVKNIVITISLYMLVGCVMIFLIQHPMEEARKYGKSFRMLANWTYYVHPLVIMLIKVFIGDINTVGLFLVTCMISLVSGFILINVGGWFKRILLE